VRKTRQLRLPFEEANLPANIGWHVTREMLGKYETVPEASRAKRMSKHLILKRFHEGWRLDSKGKWIKASD
jgi:hypothetical protein